jgi:hypothetical protein
MPRFAGDEERFVLPAMHQTLVERGPGQPVRDEWEPCEPTPGLLPSRPLAFIRGSRPEQRIPHLPASAAGGIVRVVKRLLIALLGLIVPALVFPPGTSAAEATVSRWTPERAWAWHHAHPWLVGCNFLPSTAVNDVEMWRKESFDPTTIDRELGWAQELGFNTGRVFLNFVIWREDADGLKQRFAEFLKIADRHGISVMPILFDDCNFAGRAAAVGPQPAPVPGVHNSQWVSSPPLAMVTDRAAWPALEQYVKDLVGAFARDRRIVVWDLYNEPGNGMGEKSRPLVEAAFAWAREMKPTQPLTVGAWTDFNSSFSRRKMELSDVVSFHAYDGLAGTEAKVKICREYGRPILCTEWMARGHGSRFETHLPYFKENRIACWNWGLVAGRTQTYFPWGSPQGAPEPKLWHHDIFRADGTPFHAREVESIKVTTGRLPPRALPQRKVLVATAEHAPVAWRFTVEKPADDWFRPDFNDSTWKQGTAPFGTLEPPFARKPNTSWTNADIWLRREFEMPAGQFTDLALLLHHDEETEVYINGALAVKADGYNAAYESLDISPEAQAALKPGRNIFAAHCRQTLGGQYFDLGIEGVAAEASAGKATTSDCTYRGWKTLALRNGLVDLEVLPEIGGRIIQFRLGAKDNPSFRPDFQRGLMHVQYRYQVGKIGLDSHIGWVATVDGDSGAVFVQRFVFEPKKEYPDGSSVEFWLNGLGQIRAYSKDRVMPTNAAENPCVFESEVLSPFADLKPGQSHTWRYDWYACNIGGAFPVLNCSDAGVVAEALSATEANGRLRLRGRFGVFAPGQLEVALINESGRVVSRQRLPGPVTPRAAVWVTAALQAPSSATAAALALVGENGRTVGESGRARISP